MYTIFVLLSAASGANLKISIWKKTFGCNYPPKTPEEAFFHNEGQSKQSDLSSLLLFALPEWIADPPVWQCQNRLAPRSISLASQNKILLKAGGCHSISGDVYLHGGVWKNLTTGKYTCTNRGSLDWKRAAEKGVCEDIWNLQRSGPILPFTEMYELLKVKPVWCNCRRAYLKHKTST